MVTHSGCTNVIKIDDFFADTVQKQVLFSMELANVSLVDLIKKGNGRINYSLLLQLIMDCITGLVYAFERGFANMDIKPEIFFILKGVIEINMQLCKKNQLKMNK